MRKAPTATLVATLKREAKNLARSGQIKHSEALDQLAAKHGYRDWHTLSEAAAIAPNVTVGTLSLDPQLRPGFDSAPNEDRPAAEIKAWWEKPFAITMEDGRLMVRCLDGGAWDRSTHYGIADDMEGAAQLAARRLAEWRRFRDRPVLTFLEEGVALVKMPSRPGSDMEILVTLPDPQAAKQWLVEHGFADDA